MLSYSSLMEKIKNSRAGYPKLTNNTYAELQENGDIHVILHHTAVVVAHPNGTFTLNTGGWSTLTTKSRINEFSPATVIQRKGSWYLNDESVKFYDGIKVDANGMEIPRPPRPFTVTYAEVDMPPELRY